MTTQDSNRKIVEAYVAAFNRGDLEALRMLFAPDATIQGVLGTGQLEKIMSIWRQLVDGFAMNLTVESLIAEGDTVAARYTERGTFSAPFFGAEPTGKSYEMVAIEWFVIRDGKIVERWGARDQATQARQLGMKLE
jgi:steroid delta-isomerase-like uncharacterized protein